MRSAAILFFGLALLSLGLLPACGPDAPEAPPGGGVAPWGSGPLKGDFVAQEVWLTYFSPPHATMGRRIHRTEEEAQHLAESLRKRVLAGEDIGEIATAYSNAPGAAARGFSGVLPVDREHPTDRERALASVAVGEVTPIVDWLGGKWFARRIDAEAARLLSARMTALQKTRMTFRAIVLLYRGAYVPNPALAAGVTRSRERAVKLARQLLERARAGEDFAKLAGAYSDDPVSAAQGGLVTVPRKGNTRTKWIHRYETWVPDSVLKAVFSGESNRLYPEVIVSPRGVFVVRIGARKKVQ